MKVLIAEDNPIFQAMLKRLLTRWEYEIVSALDGNEAWSILQGDDPPQLAILDWMMPGMDGVEVCRRVRGAGREPYTYIILLTARTQAEDLVEGMDAGADDYLTKPFNAHELRVRLRAGRRILDLQQELVKAREALREQACHDGLTGLFNRITILEMLQNEIGRSRREKTPMSLLMLDLDHFKKINDTYGHLAGDAVLREAAKRMKAVVRQYDAVGRYGGEEFLVLMPGSDVENSMAQAERIRQIIAAEPCPFGEANIPMTCSIGFASTASGIAPIPNELIREADSALYEAKRSGRNRTVAAVGPIAATA